MLSKASISLAKRGVAASASDPDRRLDMLSSSSIELRASWTTQESRSVEWAGLFLPDLDLDTRKIEQLIADRNSARQSKNWEEADRCRDDLTQMGVLIEDTPKGTEWKLK